MAKLKSSGPMGALRLRFRLLEIGLFLPVVVTAALGVGYLKALHARQRAIEVAGRQLARRVADRALAAASARGDSAARAILGPPGNLGHASSELVLQVMQRVTDSLRACRCGPIKEGAYFFYWVPETGEFVTSAPVSAVTDPRTRLKPQLRFDPQIPNDIRAAGGSDSTGAWLIHYRRLVVGRTQALVGMDISMASWWADTFMPAIAATRRQYFPMVPDPDTAFAAFLRHRQTELGRDGGHFATETATASTPFGAEYSLGITINPAVLSTLLASGPPPSYPVLVGALAASLALSALALILLRQVRQTVAQREAFVASISHELRTPLTEVLLHAESLHLDRQTPEAKGRAAASIVRETRRLIGLVENALTMAGAGRAEREPPPSIPVAPVVRDALRFLEPAIADRRARVDATLDADARAAIDPVALDRIVTNLIENALRYGEEGQTIRVSLQGGQQHVLLAVDDQGPGVPASERGRIWDVFERGAAARRTNSAGVGMGLAIVKHLVEVAGGSVGIGDSPSGGARFAVTLPVSPGQVPSSPLS